MFIIAIFITASSCVDNSTKASGKGDGSTAEVQDSDEERVSGLCGNGEVDPGEICDGDMILCSEIDGGVYSGGKAKCNRDCTGWKTVTCEYVESICGDGKVEGTEKCDGNIELCRNIDSEKYASGKAECLNDCSGWSEITCEEKVDYPDAECGDGKIDGLEICEKNDTKECVEINSTLYIGGLAECNSLCRGWDESTCEENCILKDHTECYDNDLYWYSSCDDREDKKEECENGCENGACKIVWKERKTIQWGSSDGDEGNGVAIDSSGNIYVVGSTHGSLDGNSSIGDWDVYLTKLSVDGTKLWTRQWGTSSKDVGTSVAVDSLGNVFVGGYTEGSLDGNTNAGAADIFLTKFSNDGVKQRTWQWGTYAEDRGYSMTVDSFDNLYIAGGITGSTDIAVSFSNGFLTQLSTDGEKLWTKEWGKSGFFSMGYSVAIDSSGNIYVTGVLNINTTFLTKYSTDGVEIWTKEWGGTNWDAGRSVVIDRTDNIYLYGNTKGSYDGSSNSEDYHDIFLKKLSNDGMELWSKEFGTLKDDGGYSVAVDSSGNIYTTGYINARNFNSFEFERDFFLAKFASDGTELWSESRETSFDEVGHFVTTDSSDNVYVTGYTLDSLGGNINNGASDIFLSIIPAE